MGGEVEGDSAVLFCYGDSGVGRRLSYRTKRIILPRGKKEREFVLTSHDDGSPVMGRLCDQARGKNTAVNCLYFEFPARKEQSVTNILCSLLK